MDAIAFIPTSSPLMWLSPVVLSTFLRNPFQVVFAKRVFIESTFPEETPARMHPLLDLRWAEATLTQ